MHTGKRFYQRKDRNLTSRERKERVGDIHEKDDKDIR